ncbi:MAG: DUF362 domain-containing protein, partial [Coriobacteriia bacterium]|nr:DUF362 domain-containing protein [Coriobacteriia bacterium]
MSINTPEDRELILRDKAAREGFNVPQDVIDFLVNRFDSEVGLKSALINIAMFASYRSIPISLDVAKLVIDGERVRPLSTMTPEYEAERATTSTSAPAEKRVPATPMQAASAAPKTPAASAASPTPKLAATPPAVKSEQQDDPPSLFDLPIPTPAPSAPQPQVPEHDLTAPFTVQPAQKAATPVTEPAASTIPTPEQAPVAAPISVSPEPTTSAPAKPAPVARFCSQTGKPLNQETTVPPTPVATPAPEPVVPMPMPTPAVQQAQYFQPIKEAPPQQSEAQMRLVSQTGSDVFFIPLRTQRKRSLFERINLALTRAGIDDVIQADDKVAVKIHFGEEGNTGFVSPVHARNVVNRVKELGGKPFLTDTNTLYAGQRQNAIDHINCAIANGFGYSTVGAPIIIADGLISRDSVVVPVAGGKHFESVRVASATIDADVMIVISHVKGHSLAGFGGAIKNIGMGLGSRSAKQRMHSGIKPSVVPDNCTACARCI